MLKLQQPANNAPSISTVLLFGELLVDCFPDKEVPGGAPFNVACHLVGLGSGVGLDPALITRIGKDERGLRLLQIIQAAGMTVDGVQQDATHPTGEVRITLDSDTGGHSFEIAPNQAWDFIHAETAQSVALAHRPQWVYFGTLAQRGTSRFALRTLLQTTCARGFLDVNLRDPWVSNDVLRWSLEQAEIVKLNEEELHRIGKMLEFGKSSPRSLGERLIHSFDIRRLLVTQGAGGAWLLDGDGEYFHTPAERPVVDVVDSVGAGDAFAAVSIIGLVQGWPADRILERAHRFAGEVCRLRGAVPDSLGFYQPFIADWQLTRGNAT